ncbi:DUF3987 domain-containing protein [Rhodococcus sp. IEGM 248]|nr:DUF3987 domain-containing protein [Rhodococcus sp. IEGM 248]
MSARDDSLRRLDFDSLLDLLGRADGELTAVCHRPIGGPFKSSVVESGTASVGMNLLPDRACVWFSVNPVRGPARVGQGRGREKDVTRWASLYLDVDVKDGSFPDLDKALGFVDRLSGLAGARPSAMIFSGHGVQPLWPIENGELDCEDKWVRACKLSRRFGRLAVRVAGELSASLDTVSDLSRVLRVPGMRNWKDPASPAETYAVADSGAALTLDGLEELLDEWAPEIDSDQPLGEEPVSNVEDWGFAAGTCRYVSTMVHGWATDRPTGGRHQWALSRCVRVAAAHRLGCITATDLRMALRCIETALSHWCEVVGPKRDLHPDEVGSAFRWAVARVETFTERRARDELGRHKSCSGETSEQGASAPADGFWELTSTLRHTRDFARARRVSPWAMLGVALANVVTTIPPTVQIPPLVGGRASLNLFVGLVGDSGQGKGAVEKAAKDAFLFGPIYSTGIGSGEGINHKYARYDKDRGSVLQRTAVLFSVPEIDSLAALGQRNAATLLPQLRKGWCGEELSFAYAAKEKDLLVPEHAYRMTLVAGIQRGKAGALIDDSDGGTPQRFIWLPTLDPGAPEVKPPAPEPFDLTGIACGWPSSGADAYLASAYQPYEIALPEEAVALVDRDRLAKLKGESTDSALDGHLGLCRIKVAVALALLHSCRTVTSEFWAMSKDVMSVSQATRADVEKHLADRVDRDNRARGRADGVRAVEADGVREDAETTRAAKAVRHKLEKLGGEGTPGEVKRGLHSRYRVHFEGALDRLVGAGAVKVSEGVIKLTSSVQ